MATEIKRANGLVVTKTKILGSGRFVFDAYEPSSYFGKHSTLFTIEGQCHGSVPSRRLPEEIDIIPVGSARWEALDAFRSANETEAYAAILAAFPEAAKGHLSMGHIDLY